MARLSERSLQLDLEEAELVGVRVDYVMRDALGARVRHARLELDFAHACGLLQPQLAGGERHDHVVVGVDVVAGLGAGREAPFRDDDAIGFDLGVRCGFHGCGLDSWKVGKPSPNFTQRRSWASHEWCAGGKRSGSSRLQVLMSSVPGCLSWR